MSIFRNKNFLIIFSARNISDAGTQLQDFGLSLYVLLMTGSALQFSLTLVVQMIPLIISAPFSGYFADRFNRKHLAILYDLLSASVVAALFILFTTFHRVGITQVYICILLLSFINAFYSSALSGLNQSAVMPDDYAKSASVTSSVRNAVSLAIPAIAGLLYGFGGLLPLLAINFVSFTLSAFLELFLTVGKRNPEDGDGHDDEGFAQSMRTSIQYLKSEPFIAKFIVIGAGLNLVLSPVNIGVTVVSNKVLHINPAQLGIVESLITAGALLGSVLGGILLTKKVLTVKAIMLSCVASMITGYSAIAVWYIWIRSHLAYLPNIVVFSAANIIIIVVIIIFQIYINVELQKIIPNRIMGRISAFMSAALCGSTPLGQAATGIGFEFSYPGTYLSGTALSTALLLYIKFSKTTMKAKTSAIIE